MKQQLVRKTNETKIDMTLDIYGTRQINIQTPIGFINHMLELLAFHACFDLEIQATGDTDVDAHHIVEDLGIVFGELFRKSLETQGIKRYGQCLLPMDETLTLVALDISNRGYLGYNVQFSNEWFNGMASETIEEFFQAFTRTAQVTLHFNCLTFKNNHHLVESMFKGFGRAIKDACTIENNIINSTKGML